jgi:hypothetical protein
MVSQKLIYGILAATSLDTLRCQAFDNKLPLDQGLMLVGVDPALESLVQSGGIYLRRVIDQRNKGVGPSPRPDPLDLWLSRVLLLR